eukprot:TRINITY_DN438_c0_g1_i3.p1 TRINITY_DN438_c0_g1~~TRINITY_DN438_c0_g1_i3.p1  ORF type:complete len:135 (+),score=22.65 TRINITY_DN438_c0_g1_i3:428-832(+)
MGWAIGILATFNIDHFDLFGLKQAWGISLSLAPAPPDGGTGTQLSTSYLYCYVRHPIMTGFLIAFWAIPSMTMGQLLWSVACTGQSPLPFSLSLSLSLSLSPSLSLQTPILLFSVFSLSLDLTLFFPHPSSLGL